jgi:hypothetical protein
MNKRATRLAAAGALGAAALTGAGIVTVSASGGTTAAPDVNRVGAITLKANGAVVTSGHLTDKLTAVGTANSALNGAKAVVYGYVHSAYAYAGPATSANLTAYKPTAEGTWTGSQLTPAVANQGLSVPLGTSETLQQLLAGYHPDSTGLVELRLRTISPGEALSDAYDAVDIYVDPAAGTWSTARTGGSGTVAKKKATVTEKLATKVKHTARAKVKVAVSGSGATPTGTVSILDGAKKLASAKLTGGRATVTLPKLKKGKHHIKATYSGSSTFAAASSKTITVTSK